MIISHILMCSKVLEMAVQKAVFRQLQISSAAHEKKPSSNVHRNGKWGCMGQKYILLYKREHVHLQSILPFKR